MRFAFWRRKPPPDNRWWEDGHPVVVAPFTGMFQLAMSRQVCAAEWDITLDITRQLFGDGEWHEVQGLESLR